MKSKEERKKLIAWELLKSAFINGVPHTDTMAACIARNAKELVDELDNIGCFEDRYGDRGSYEVEVVAKVFPRQYSIEHICFSGPSGYIDGILEAVRKEIASGEIADEQKSRCAVLLLDEKKRIAIENAKREKEEQEIARAAAEKKAKEDKLLDLKNRIAQVKARREAVNETV